MGRIKWAISLLTLILCSAILSGCIAGEAYEGLAVSCIGELSGTRLSEFDSPNTLCTKEKDGTYSLYIYAAPVLYKEGNGYRIIDNGLIESSQQSYAFENRANDIKACFPRRLEQNFMISDGTDTLWIRPSGDVSGFSEAEKCTHTNIYGDRVEAAIYRGEEMDYVFYPTKFGIRAEAVYKRTPAKRELPFYFIAGTAQVENNHNGYLVFNQKDGEAERHKAVISGPVVKGCDGKISWAGDIRHQDTMQGTDLQFTYVDDRGPATLDLSFSLYRQKIPDTAVYANSKTNAALSEWSTAGGDPCKGEGWQYMRFRLNAVCGFAPTDILSADFHTRRLDGSEDPQSLQMYYAEGQWSSMNMLWGNRYAANVAVEDSRGKQTGNELCFTVTDFVKRAFGDPEWLVESNGLVLRGGDYGTEGYQTVATSDHALYTPYIRIRSVKPPMYLDKDAGMG